MDVVVNVIETVPPSLTALTSPDSAKVGAAAVLVSLIVMLISS